MFLIKCQGEIFSLGQDPNLLEIVEMIYFRIYLIAENKRHPKNVFVCGHCGELSEKGERWRISGSAVPVGNTF